MIRQIESERREFFLKPYFYILGIIYLFVWPKVMLT